MILKEFYARGDCIIGLANQFFQSLLAHDYSHCTILEYQKTLRRFILWCLERMLDDISLIDRYALERYHQHLTKQSNCLTGKALSAAYRKNHLKVISAFFGWLHKTRVIVHNPALSLQYPKLPKILPQHALTAKEADLIIGQAKGETPREIRDRAIMELLYSTGIRRSECVMLRVTDVDFERRRLWVRKGKGKKERVLPVGKRAIHWLEKYVNQARAKLLKSEEEQALFVSKRGRRFNENAFWKILSEYVCQANINKKGACHLFRHSMATLMLENGADIRYIQEMLGHTELSATEIYTKVSIAKLKEVHKKTHPARLNRSSQTLETAPKNVEKE